MPPCLVGNFWRSLSETGVRTMKCQNCEAQILPSDERCQNCGAIPLRRRVFSSARREDFTLTAEEEPFELGDISDTEDWQICLRAAVGIGSTRRGNAEPVKPRNSVGRVLPAHLGFWSGPHCHCRAFDRDVLYVLCGLQSRIVRPWPGPELGAIDAAACFAYLGSSRISYRIFCNFSWHRGQNHW